CTPTSIAILNASGRSIAYFASTFPRWHLLNPSPGAMRFLQLRPRPGESRGDRLPIAMKTAEKRLRNRLGLLDALPPSDDMSGRTHQRRRVGHLVLRSNFAVFLGFRRGEPPW